MSSCFERRGLLWVLMLLLAISVGGRAEPQQRPPRPAPAAPAQPAQAQPPTQPVPDAPADPQQPAADQPVFRAGINFVRVDVIVTDEAGNLVTDLAASDFEVLEDDAPQTIESFKLINISSVPAPGAEPPRPILNDFDEEREAARDDVRIFVIFFDDYHVRRENGVRAQPPLVEFIQTQLVPTDLVAVMYPLTPLEEVRLTRNHQAIAGAIERFDGRKYDYQPRNAFEERYAYYPTTTVEQIRNDVSLSALKGLVTHLGTLREGRKALVLVSEGYSNYVPPQLRSTNALLAPSVLDPNVGDPLAGDTRLEETQQFFDNSTILMDLREVFSNANRNNTAIYSVDPRGLAVSEFDSSQRAVSFRTDERVLRATQDTLHVLAEETDGRAIVNQNDLRRGLRQMVRDLSAYYLIGYTSSQTPSDGKFHEIEVRVKRRGVRVRARKGYWALTAEQTARALQPAKPEPPRAVDKALATLAEPRRGRVVRTWVGTSRGENGKTRVRFVWEGTPTDTARTDMPSRVLLTASAASGSAYFRGRVPAAAVSSGARRALGSRARAGPPPGAQVEFDANPGTMQLSVAVEGQDGEVLDRDSREIQVPDFTSVEVGLSTPYVVRARTALELRSLSADWAVVPTAAREFRRTDRLLIRFEAYAPGGSTPTVRARLLNRAGERMSDLPVQASAAAGQPYQADVTLANLPPGEYLVDVAASTDGGEDARELLAFRLVS